MFDGFDLDSDFIRNLDSVLLEGSYTCSFYGDQGAIVSPKTYFSTHFSPIGAYSSKVSFTKSIGTTLDRRDMKEGVAQSVLQQINAFKAGSDFVPLSYSHQLFNSLVASPASSNKSAMYSSWPVLPSTPFLPPPPPPYSSSSTSITNTSTATMDCHSSLMPSSTPSSFGRRDGEFIGAHPFSSYCLQLNSSTAVKTDHANRGMIHIQMPKPNTYDNSVVSSSSRSNSNDSSNSNSNSNDNRSDRSNSSSSSCRNDRNKSKKNFRSRKILEKLPSSVSVFGEIYTEIHNKNRSDMDDKVDGDDYGVIHTDRMHDDNNNNEEEDDEKQQEEEGGGEEEEEFSFNFIRPVAATESGNAFIDRVLSAEGNKRGRKSLSNYSTNVLRSWIINHHENPYPSQREKDDLARDAKLTVKQVVDWMTNVRKRKLTPYLPKSTEGVTSSSVSSLTSSSSS